MTTEKPRQLHLLSFPLHTGSHVAGWRHSGAKNVRLDDIDFYRQLAETSERGKFDAIFYADSQGYRPIEGRDAFSRTDVFRMDALMVLAATSVWTKHLGLIGTLSTSYNEPYGAARRLQSLDIMSGGRAGWNIVTSTTENEARNFGRESHFEHDLRYERAAEFVEVCKALWDSIDADAFVVDQNSGRYFEPDRVHGVAHKGKFFSVAGPLTMSRSPQGYPVFVQAGSSDAGQALAAAVAEVVFTTSPTLEISQKTYRELKEKVAAAGRDPRHCHMAPAMHPIIADTEQEAREILANLNDLVPADLAISVLQQSLGGFDLSKYDPNGPLPEVPETNRNRTVRALVVGMAEREKLNIAQLAKRVVITRSSFFLTGAPEQIADTIEKWFKEGGADGFAISGPTLPLMLDRFVDQVVPILQQRGLFRKEYEGRTLRDHLELPHPLSRHTGRPDLHIEPEIWQKA